MRKAEIRRMAMFTAFGISSGSIPIRNVIQRKIESFNSFDTLSERGTFRTGDLMRQLLSQVALVWSIFSSEFIWPPLDRISDPLSCFHYGVVYNSTLSTKG